MSNKFNQATVYDFLDSLAVKLGDHEGYIELRSLPDKSRGHGHSHYLPTQGVTPRMLQNATDWADRESSEGRGVFVGYNVRSEEKGDKESVKVLSANYQDLDYYKLKLTQREVLDAVLDGPVAPDMVINSGQGIQMVYLNKGITDEAQWLHIQETLYEYFRKYGADRAVVTDTARILRLPGCPNHKQEEPLETAILFDDGAVFSRPFSRLTDGFGKPGDPKIDKTKSEKGKTAGGITIDEYEVSAVKGWLHSGRVLHKGNPLDERHVEGLGGRDDAAMRLARHYEKIGLAFEEALPVGQAICDFKMDPPYGDDEADETWEAKLRAAYKKFRGTDKDDWGNRANNVVRKEAVNQGLVAKLGLNDQTEEVQVAVRASTPFVFGGLHEVDEPFDEVIGGLAKGMVGMMQSSPNTGKSTYMLNLGIALSVGREFGPLNVARKKSKGMVEELAYLKRKVLYIDKENGRAFLKKDLRMMVGGTYVEKKLDADGVEYEEEVQHEGNLTEEERVLFEQNFAYACEHDIAGHPLNLSNKVHLDFIGEWVLKYKIDLVVIDTLAASFSLADENSNSEVQSKLLNPLTDFAKEFKCAVLLIHHVGKAGLEGGGVGDSMYKARGASAIPATCRLLLELTPVYAEDEDGQKRRVEGSAKLRRVKSKGFIFPNGDKPIRVKQNGRRWYEEDIVPQAEMSEPPLLRLLRYISMLDGDSFTFSSKALRDAVKMSGALKQTKDFDKKVTELLDSAVAEGWIELVKGKNNKKDYGMTGKFIAEFRTKKEEVSDDDSSSNGE